MISYGAVTLRRVEPSDHPLIQTWQNDPEVARWMNYDRLFDLQDIHDSEAKARTEGHPFIIEADGHPIGRIGLNQIHERDRMASLYIYIGDRKAWGRGYGRDALFALLSFGFGVLNLRKIGLWLLAGNERASAAYKSVGFIEDARLPERTWLDGEYVDHIVMSVDRAGFERAIADATG